MMHDVDMQTSRQTDGQTDMPINRSTCLYVGR